MPIPIFSANLKGLLKILNAYKNYLMVGGGVGIGAVIVRECIGKLLPNTRGWYIATILLIYAGGILVSYFLQKRYTFSKSPTDTQTSRLLLFAVITIATGLITAALSYLIRYSWELDLILGKWGPSVAFLSATLITSLLNFSLISRFVFRKTR